jgi:hypothetical protein
MTVSTSRKVVDLAANPESRAALCQVAGFR